MPRGTSHHLMKLRGQLRREGGVRVCGVCGNLVDMTLPSTHPYSFELDHIFPRSRGGPDVRANLRITHRRCNRQRGAGRQRANTPTDRSADW